MSGVNPVKCEFYLNRAHIKIKRIKGVRSLSSPYAAALFLNHRLCAQPDVRP